MWGESPEPPENVEDLDLTPAGLCGRAGQAGRTR